MSLIVAGGLTIDMVMTFCSWSFSVTGHNPLKYFNFSHPEYKQLHSQFIPYLSIIDLIFNEGPKSLKIIQEGCN